MSEELNKAMKLMADNQFEDAIRVFNEVLDQTPDDSAEILNNIGVAYANLNQLEDAEQSYTKSIQLNPLIPQTYINLSDLFYKRGEYELAIDVLLTGKGNLPENVVIPHYLARIYMGDARLDLAIDELDKVLEAQPNNYDAYYDLARVYFELGNWEAAISNFENVLEYVTNNALIYFYLGEAYEANNEIDKAISNYLKATTINEKFHPAYKKLGILFLARKDYSDAVEYFEEYIKMDIPEEEIENTNKILDRIKAAK